MGPPGEISYHITSLGCSKNLVDSERIHGGLGSRGLAAAARAEDADILIINTCGFIEDAKKESIDSIFQALSLKGPRSRRGSHPPRKIVVTGCLSQRYARALREDIPEIDFLYGVVDDGFFPALFAALGMPYSRRGPVRMPLVPAAYRYIKISEGCSNRCSYCAIPSIRGPRVSFSPAAVLAGARSAAADGAKELIVVAQDVASYRHGRTTLSGLVRRMGRIEGVEWVRLMYCHPDHVDDSLIDLVARDDRVVKYMDIPFQHSSGRILRSMGRRGDASAHLGLIERLRARVPGIRIRSTFMVGYPGETEKEFAGLLEFVRDSGIDRAGCFMYSREEGTAAALLPGRVPRAVKLERYRKFMRLQRGISARKLASMVGATVRVLVEGKIDRRTWMGRTEFDAPEVDGIFYLTARGAACNSIVMARVVDSSDYDLHGVPA